MEILPNISQICFYKLQIFTHTVPEVLALSESIYQDAEQKRERKEYHLMVQCYGTVCQTQSERQQQYTLLFHLTGECTDLNFRLTIHKRLQLCVIVCILIVS